MQPEVIFNGAKLQELCSSKGLSLETISAQLEIPLSKLVQYEKDLAVPDIRDLFLLAYYFKVPAEYFIEFKMPKEKRKTKQSVRHKKVKISMLKRQPHYIDPDIAALPADVLGLPSRVVRGLYRCNFPHDTVGDICSALESGNFLKAEALGEKTLLMTLIAVYKLTGEDFSDAFANFDHNIKDEASDT